MKPLRHCTILSGTILEHVSSILYLNEPQKGILSYGITARIVEVTPVIAIESREGIKHELETSNVLPKGYWNSII